MEYVGAGRLLLRCPIVPLRSSERSRASRASCHAPHFRLEESSKTAQPMSGERSPVELSWATPTKPDTMR